MREPAARSAGAVRRFLTFRMERRLYALPAEDVAEVIRLPSVARVPQAPPALLGIANLRGSVLPLASLRGLMGVAETSLASSRAIVLSSADAVAIAVDSVDALVSIESDKVESRQAELGAETGETLKGAFPAGDSVAKILDLQALLDMAFARRGRVQRQKQRAVQAPSVAQDSTADLADAEMLVTFEVAGQEFALPLATVQEIVTAPQSVTAMPRAEALVIGMMSFRDRLLPLLSLRGLLGFGKWDDADRREKVIVAKVAGALVGLVADRTRAILAAPRRHIEPVPPVLAARAGGEARIQSIYRADQGRSLISILSPELLFREDVMARLAQTQRESMTKPGEENANVARELKFVVFRLGEDEFALPADAVAEVATVPEQITRVPKTPKFLEGVVNLRGEILPVVDQRRRFEMPALEQKAGRRLIVVRTASHRAGVIVDGVSEVLAASSDQIGEPPDLTERVSRLVKGVINLEKQNRMLLILDPAELLTQAERGQLDAFVPNAGSGDT